MRRSFRLARAHATRPRLSRLLLGAALVALVVGGCDCGEDLAALPGTVSGNLCSVETGAPLPSHTLTIESKGGALEVRTDLFGQYEARGVSPGPATVSAEVEGELRTWEVTVVPGETVKIVDDQCRPPPPPPPAPAGAVVGCICDDQRGHWVSGANVWVVGPSGEPFATGTDDEGCFALEGVPVGEHVLKIQQGSFYREEPVTVVEGEEVALSTPESCEPPEVPTSPSGAVSGRVCAPDGTTWLGGAIVSAETEDGRVETSTDENGYYTLEGVPVGDDVAITIRKGSFETVLLVDVAEGELVVIPEEDCAIDQNVRIAVVNGGPDWSDDVKGVLLNVGIDPASITDYGDSWATQLLSDYAQLAQYDIVLLNCGLNDGPFLTDAAGAGVMKANLRQFVENGGSVYASDWAYNVIESSFPEFIDFHGDDAAPHAAKKGFPTSSLVGTVTDFALATMLGSNQIALHYPLGQWVIMASVAARVRVYIRGDAPWSNNPISLFPQGTLSNVPHTVSFSVGEGKVVYTSFHQEPGINQQMERVLQLLVFEL